MASKKQEKVDSLLVVCMCLIFILLMIIALISYGSHRFEAQKEYYKKQMLSFCELSHILYEYSPEEFHNPRSSEILEKDCSYWIAEGDFE